ncbi:MAG: SGNH/GDSL hydrolase family protein [Melioribacteraceae bacterium]|nr:SGNH/GDSL hydrolase family protein [Melioribacteraceae bacterium]
MKILIAVVLFSFFGNKCEITKPEMEPQTYKYLALGDSYTIGESVSESERYPVQLKNRLFDKNIKIDSLKIIAKTGWTTDELNDAINLENPSNDYDLVTLLIGVNNQYRGRSAESFRPEFIELLNRAVGFAKGDSSRVIVISIPDWGVTPFGDRDRRTPAEIGAEIDSYNSIKEEECLNRGIKYIHITDISREAKTDMELLAFDQLHPSGKMYSLWVERILPLAEEIFKESK